MTKMFVTKLLAMLMALLMVAGMAAAEEEPQMLPGNVPERGLVFPMTEADTTELKLTTSYIMAASSEVSELPLMSFVFGDEEGLQKGLAQFSEEDLANEEMFMDILMELFSHNHSVYNIVLYEKDYYDAKKAEGKTAADVVDHPLAVELGENDGYVYVGVPLYEETLEILETDTQKAAAQKAFDRCDELIANIAFQPVVFAAGEKTTVPHGDLEFTTQDLNGNTVTDELFLGKKLTVLNIWGTHCTPCVEEMPELAEWSQNMPEGVQLVGLVSDLNSADNADILETAKMICEATGADAYVNLIANADFYDLLSGVVGVPTTLFIDGNGVFVGDPIVGANVPACKNFVESYLAE